ncbi:MAG: hypothetical protein ACRYG8_38380 [Janthinobacterium lividum]
MTGNDGALGRLLDQVGAGTDCLVEGTPAASRGLFARAAAAAAERAEIISVVSPLGELGLSALIAQVSGRPDFDEQDDAVLELGFKRLTAPDRPTVLMLWAPQGVAMPTLRYLQYVRRSAPGLVIVAFRSPALDAALEQPGAVALRARLRAAPAIVADEETAPLPPLADSPPLAAVAGPIPLSVPVRRRAWLLPWGAAVVSVAAASVIVVQLSRVPDLDASVSVPVSVPVSAPVTMPVSTAATAPVPATTQTTTVIPPAPAEIEMPLTVQPQAVPPITFPSPAPVSAPVVTPPLPPLAKPERVLHARRIEPKPRGLSRAGRPGADWRADELTQYTWENRTPPWHRLPRWADEPGPGGYVVDRYGTPYYPFTR